MPTLSDFNDFIAAVRKDTGLASLVPDESGLVSVRVDDTYNVNLQFVEATGKILCFIEVATLTKDAPAAVDLTGCEKVFVLYEVYRRAQAVSVRNGIGERMAKE